MGLTMNTKLAILASVVVSTNAYIGDYRKIVGIDEDNSSDVTGTTATEEPVVEEDPAAEEDLLDEDIDEEEYDDEMDGDFDEQVEPRDTVGEQNDLGDDDELSDPAPEEAETDPITDAAIVAAEDLSDIAAETESDNNEDDFKGTHYIDHEQNQSEGKDIKVVVNDDGELFLQASGASTLAASAITLLAISSIIY